MTRNFAPVTKYRAVGLLTSKDLCSMSMVRAESCSQWTVSTSRTTTYHKLLAAGPVSVVPAYTPEGCTDLLAVIDDPAIGKTGKDLVKKRFRVDFTVRHGQYCNGDVKPAEFRKL